jgi:light-harvesting protein B-800-850 alpha chain
MNQYRIWLVVKPTVGLPLFLGTVLIISLLVHAAVLTNTSWFPAFFEGSAKAQTAAAPAALESTVVASN